MVQLIYPDRNGFLPYEAGFDQRRMRLAQPVIGMRRRAVTPATLGQHFERPGRPGPATWVNAPRCLCRPRRRAGCGRMRSGNEAFEPTRDARVGRRSMREKRTTSVGAPHRVPGCPATRPATGSSSRSPPTGRFALETGHALTDVTVAYETWGTLDEHGEQRRAAVPRLDRRQPRHRPGRARPSRRPGGGRAMVGPGRPIDTDRWFVVCANVLGGCQGIDRAGVAAPGRRPAVRLAVPGASRSATWCAPRPGSPTTSASTAGTPSSAARWAGCRCSSGRSCTRSGCARSSRSPRACRRPPSRSPGERSGAGRSRLDPRWRGGDYYDAEPGDGPDEGLAVARMVAQVTFRSDNVFTERFGRDLADRTSATPSGCGSSSRSSATSSTTAPSSAAASTPTATSSSARRWTSTTSPAAAAAWPAAMARIQAPTPGRSASRPTCCTRTTSSARSTRCCAPRACGSRYVEIDSPHGHDAFLINLDQLGEPIAEFLDPG